MLNKEDAYKITCQIKRTSKVLSDTVIRAYDGKVWVSMGYDSWDTYCKSEFKSGCIRMPKQERMETVAALKDRGLSNRIVASSLGVSDWTVRNDRKAGARNHAPDPDARVTGLDGKSYPAKRHKPTLDSEIDSTALLLSQGGQVPTGDYGPPALTEDLIYTQESIKKDKAYEHLHQAEVLAKQLYAAGKSALDLDIPFTESRSIEAIRNIGKLLSDMPFELSDKVIEGVGV